MSTDPKMIERIAEAVRAQLGPRATEHTVREAVSRVLAENAAPPAPQAPAPSGRPRSARPSARNRGVLSCVGANRPGVLAALSGVLAQHGADIHHISQNLVDDLFTMVIVFDLDAVVARGFSFRQLKERLETASRSLGGIETVVMHERVLRSMHRV